MKNMVSQSSQPKILCTNVLFPDLELLYSVWNEKLYVDFPLSSKTNEEMCTHGLWFNKMILNALSRIFLVPLTCNVCAGQ